MTDSAGAVVQGATVTATNQATSAARSADTNSSGAYSITNLAPGVYSVAIEKAGSKTIRFDAIPLSVAQALALNAQFTVGSVQKILQVNGGETAPIETETSQLSTLVDSKTMAGTDAASQVMIDNFVYSPVPLSVKLGTTVTWINHGDIPHTVDCTEGKFKSAALDTNDHFTFRFSEAGEYPFYCRIHPKMTGKIIVQPQ